MGIIEAFFGTDSKKDSKKGVVKMTGVIEGRSKTVEKKILTPKIKSVEWKNRRGEDISKAKYGQEVSLLIETEEANGCWLFVSVCCDNWEKPLYKFVEVDWITTPLDKCTKVSFIPRFKDNKDKSIEKTQIQAEAWVLWHQFNNTELKKGSSDQVYLEKLCRYLKGEDVTSYGTSFLFVKSSEKSLKSRELSLSRIVIVIDPGHGVNSGFTGTQCRSYRYYEEGEKGDPDRTKIKIAKAPDLPDYVLTDINKWIIRWTNDLGVGKEEQEWYYVIDVALFLKEKLEKYLEYRVIMTREVEVEGEKRVQIVGKDVFNDRKAVANNNNADYFISVHCDGQGDNPTKDNINTKDNKFTISGSFIVIPAGEKYTNSKGLDTELSKELGEHIMEFNNVVPHDSKPIQGTDGTKSIFTKDNYCQRRIIIELGRMTNPSDTRKLYATGAQRKVAKQIADGIICNIRKNYGE